jgi:hypothetical protein
MEGIMSKLKVSTFVLAIFCSIIISCQDEENDPIKFRVTSTEGNFAGGRYNVNGGSTKTFAGTSMGNDIYEFEVKLNDLDYLEIHAQKIDEGQSLEIRIYRNRINVKEEIIEPYEQSGTDYIFNASLDYEYDEENNSNASSN